MPKGVPNKRYTPEFKKHVIETMLEEKLSYRHHSFQFDLNTENCSLLNALKNPSTYRGGKHVLHTLF